MAHHPITVAAPRSLTEGAAPFLLQRDDPDFVTAVLAELPTEQGRSRLTATRAKTRDAQQVLKLFAPVQRRFHLALIEAWCETAGRPRLDPARVDSAGLVLRRLRQGASERTLEGWMRADGVVRGWLPVDRLGGPDADPLPDVRRARQDTGVVSLDQARRVLRAGQDAAVLEEDVAPMFVAPPDVCACDDRTVYYGMVNTASSELAEAEPDLDSIFEGFEAGSDAFTAHLVGPLRGSSFGFPTPPLPDRRFDASWLEALMESSSSSSRSRFLQLLRQVAIEFDAFGSSAPSRALKTQLDAIRLTYTPRAGETRAHTRSASDFLQDATRVLLEGETGEVEMPLSWPELTASDTAALAGAMSGAMRERFKAVKGRPGRFDEPDAQYVLRAFVRLKPEGGCASRTVWSESTEPFVIAPWYETSGDPVQITLPDLTNRSLLKSMKPNVAFTLPPALQALVEGDPKKLMEGKDGGGSSLGIGWICSFSIPVITFCAFIVLSIFLSLFNLIFQWMMFIKVCVPYPKAK